MFFLFKYAIDNEPAPHSKRVHAGDFFDNKAGFNHLVEQFLLAVVQRKRTVLFNVKK